MYGRPHMAHVKTIFGHVTFVWERQKKSNKFIQTLFTRLRVTQTTFVEMGIGTIKSVKWSNITYNIECKLNKLPFNLHIAVLYLDNLFTPDPVMSLFVVFMYCFINCIL